MLMNMPRLRRDAAPFYAYLARHLPRFRTKTWDQDGYAEFYSWAHPPVMLQKLARRLGIGKTRVWDRIPLELNPDPLWDELPLELNWKAYWPSSENAAIVHFHGPKPGDRERCRRLQCPPNIQELARAKILSGPATSGKSSAPRGLSKKATVAGCDFLGAGPRAPAGGLAKSCVQLRVSRARHRRRHQFLDAPIEPTRRSRAIDERSASFVFLHAPSKRARMAATGAALPSRLTNGTLARSNRHRQNRPCDRHCLDMTMPKDSAIAGWTKTSKAASSSGMSSRGPQNATR